MDQNGFQNQPAPSCGKREQLEMMNAKKPNFDREGNVKTSVIGWILSLGAASKTGALTRYVVVALCMCSLFF